MTSKHDNKIIGKNIKKFRKERGYDQLELAEKLDISNSYLSKIENGKTVPSFAMLERFAEFFNKDRSYFFIDEEEISQFSDPEKQLLFERNLSPEYLTGKYFEGRKISAEEAEYMIGLLKTVRSAKNASRD